MNPAYSAHPKEVNQSPPQVWEKYAQTARLLLKEGVDESGQPHGKLLCSTVRENQVFIPISFVQPSD